MINLKLSPMEVIIVRDAIEKQEKETAAFIREQELLNRDLGSYKFLNEVQQDALRNVRKVIELGTEDGIFAKDV